jgi:hypothetical protein
MPEEQKTANQLAHEAKLLTAQAKAARARENDAANEPDRAARLREVIAETEDPARRDKYAKEKHQHSDAYKAAKEHAVDVLGEVREMFVQTRMRDLDIDPADRKELLARVGEGVSARMAAELRKAAEKMLDQLSTGDLSQVDEIRREGVLRAADAAPYTFQTPDSRDVPVADVLAAVPRI